MSHFQNLQSQMTEFEASAEPLQDWLNGTEVRVQESSARLHDLPAKKEELKKLQVLWNSRFLSESILFGFYVETVSIVSLSLVNNIY